MPGYSSEYFEDDDEEDDFLTDRDEVVQVCDNWSQVSGLSFGNINQTQSGIEVIIFLNYVWSNWKLWI